MKWSFPSTILSTLLRLCTLYLLIMLLLPDVASAQQWKVVCSDHLVDMLRRGGEAQVQAQCNDENDEGITAPVRATLESATQWLMDEAFGFSAPDNRTLDNGHYVAVVYAHEEDRCLGREACFLPADRILLVSESYVRFAEQVIVHELFHAVQQAHVGTEFFAVVGDPDDPNSKSPLGWISEGTAEAVGAAWVRRSGSSTRLQRTYDLSLTETPRQENDYEAAHFWYHLGHNIDSPESIAYLRQVLDALQKNLGSEHHGLGPVNEALQGYGGLYDVFPTFIAASVQDPDDFSKDGLEALNLRFHDRQVSEERSGRVQPIAANAYEVSIPVPEGKVAGLEIEFAEDHEDLHLIVDGGRYDKDPLDPEAERNVFRTALMGREEPHELFVRVANVAPKPAETETRSYALRFTLTPIDTCEGEQMWTAIHPAIRERAQLLPPEEYERRHPYHHVAVGELRVTGLVNDSGITCTHPAGIGTNPDAPASDMEAWSRGMQERIEGMSQEELMEMAQRMQEAMGQGRTPDQNIQGLMDATEESGLDALPNKSTLIRIFSPNALSWQQHLRSGIPSPASIHQALVEDDPVVPYDHAGIGGWAANSGLDLSLIILDADPDELREDSTYEARATLGYRRGEGKIVKSRRSTAGPGHPDYSPVWQALEGWREELGPDGSSGSPWMMHGTVTIEEITGAAVQGRFELSGMGRWLRFECPNNPLNRLGIRRRCRDDERTGAVGVSGWFEAPAPEVSRDP